MTEGPVAVGERAAVPGIMDVVEGAGSAPLDVVDGFGRLLGAIDSDDHPDLFQSYSADVHQPSVAGPPPI